MPERAGGRPGAECERAPLRRHQLAECADHDRKGGAGEPEADHRAGREMEHSRRIRVGHGRQAERVEHRSDAENWRRSIAVRQRAGHRLGRAPEQHLDRERERKHVAPPTVRARHRGEKEAQARTCAETDERDQATADQNELGGAPGERPADNGGRSMDAVRLGAIPALHVLSSILARCRPHRAQAGADAARITGFSTIGRLITAESTPNRIESHHTAS